MNSEHHGTTESTEVTEKDIERREKDSNFVSVVSVCL